MLFTDGFTGDQATCSQLSCPSLTVLASGFGQCSGPLLVLEQGEGLCRTTFSVSDSCSFFFFFHSKRSCLSCRLFLKDMFLFWLTCLPGVSAGTLTDTKTRGDLGSGAGAGGLGLRLGAPVGAVVTRCAVGSMQIRLAGDGEGSQDGRRHRHRGDADVRARPLQEAEEAALSSRQ